MTAPPSPDAPVPTNPAPNTPPTSADTPRGTGAGAANPVDPALGPPALQAPWRMSYLEGLGERERAGATGAVSAAGPGAVAASTNADAGSFLRDYWLNPARDEQNHVIVRDDSGMVLLNAFPYANGHLLVALGEGRPRLLDYAPPQRAALWRLTDLATDLLEHALQCQGVNIGVNQGRAAGAGVPGHLHVHLVPRWAGDVNFITVVARVRVIPSSLEAMAQRYRHAWGQIRARWT